MKILITTDLYLPTVNGVVTSFLSLAHGLQKRGHDVRILTLSYSNHTKVEGNVIYIPSVSAGKIYDNVRIRPLLPPHDVVKSLVRWHPDVVHSQCEFSTFAVARSVAKQRGVPLVHTYHTIYEDYTQYFSPNKTIGKKLAIWFSRITLDRTDAVIAPTDKTRKLLVSYGVTTPVSVIPTGLEMNIARKPVPDSDIEQLRKKLKLPDGKKVLLFIGRVAKEKNITSLFALLKSPLLQNSILVIVGDGPYREYIESEVIRQKLTDRVFFTGLIPHREISKYYRLGDVFVNASHSETQGLTFAEAMAAGIPVVCQADPCIAGLIDNGITGFACRNVTEMSNAVISLLRKPELYNSIVGEGIKRVTDKYSSEAFAASAEALYLKTVSRYYKAKKQTV